MAKKVTISHKTLYTGFLLVITISALNKAITERNQKSNCVIPI
jgi:hypothetical protein